MAKKISILCKEYWIKNGFSEDEAKIKIREYSCWCKEYWIKKGFSEEEAIIKIKEKQTTNALKVDQKNKLKPYEKLKKILINKGLTEKDTLLIIKNLKKENSPWCKEYWSKRGFNEENIYENIHKIQLKNALKIDQKNKINPYDLQTWINRGLSDKDAIIKIQEIKDSQNIYKNFSKEQLSNVLEKRSKTFYSKTIEKRKKINESKGRTKEQLINKFGIEYFNKISIARGNHRKNSFFRRYSKISNSFFNDLQKIVNDNLLYGENEKWIRYNKNKGFYVDLLLNKKIIEFNGDFYHANPLKYDANSIITIAKKNILTAKEIWKKDEFKINTLTKMGYEILIIWETDVVENYQDILNKCKTFLYE